MKTLKTIAIILLVLVIAGPALSQTPPPRPHKTDGAKHEKMDHMRGLDLTDQQKEQIKKIRLDMMKATTPLRNQLREKRAELQTLTSGDATDFTAAEAVVDGIAVLQAELMKKGLQQKQKIRALLTDEQRVKFDSHPGLHNGRAHHRMGRNKR